MSKALQLLIWLSLATLNALEGLGPSWALADRVRNGLPFETMIQALLVFVCVWIGIYFAFEFLATRGFGLPGGVAPLLFLITGLFLAGQRALSGLGVFVYALNNNH